MERMGSRRNIGGGIGKKGTKRTGRTEETEMNGSESRSESKSRSEIERS